MQGLGGGALAAGPYRCICVLFPEMYFTDLKLGCCQFPRGAWDW